MVAKKEVKENVEPKYRLVGLDVWFKDPEWATISYKVGTTANKWDMILEEEDRFRVLRDKKDGTREVVVLPKGTLSHWKIYAQAGE